MIIQIIHDDSHSTILSRPQLTQYLLYEPRHEISKNVVCATIKASDQPGHTHTLIRASVRCLNIL